MRLQIQHHTLYRYRQPVAFGLHRLMLMPHEGHEVSVLDFDLRCSPEAELSWLVDVFGNSVALASFAGTADELSITSRVLIERYEHDSDPIPVVEGARRLPVSYPEGEHPDLAPTLALRHPEDRAAVQAWMHEFLSDSDGATLNVLDAVNRAIRTGFEYRPRFEPGIQSPAQTLRKGSGTCRDYALLMMEAARSQGLAARFVSGYLHDPYHDPELHGAGQTHAWVQVYLPGPGWVEYDPTNADVPGGVRLRAAVARDPTQAAPVQGTYRGPAEAGLGMEVSVSVEAVDLS